MKKNTSKSDGMKITYTYIEPKADSDLVIEESGASKAFDILFTTTLNQLREKDSKGGLE